MRPSMWDIIGPGIAPMSPALTGGFFTTVTARKPEVVPLSLDREEPYSALKVESLPWLLLPSSPGPTWDSTFHSLVSRPPDCQGQGAGQRAQGWEKPLRWAGPGGVQLVTAPAAAPAGPRQGTEGAPLHDSAGAAWPQCLANARGDTP